MSYGSVLGRLNREDERDDRPEVARENPAAAAPEEVGPFTEGANPPGGGRSRRDGRWLLVGALLVFLLSCGLLAGGGLAMAGAGLKHKQGGDRDGPPWRDHDVAPALTVEVAGTSTTPLRRA